MVNYDKTLCGCVHTHAFVNMCMHVSITILESRIDKMGKKVIISIQKGHTAIDYINIGHFTRDKCVFIKCHHTVTEGQN